MEKLILFMVVVLLFWAVNLIALSHILESKKIVYTQRVLALLMIAVAVAGVSYAS